MTSFIIVAKEKEKRISYAQEYCTQLNIDIFDIALIERDSTSKNTTSIGIDDVKSMQKKIFFKPLKSQTKAVLIDESHLLTPEAQNALLKVLEEPPMHTIILLLSESKESLLATIISRCKVIVLEEEKAVLSDKAIKEYDDFIERLPNLSIGESLKKAEHLAKDKDKAIKWIENLILILRKNMLKSARGTRDTRDTRGTRGTLQALHSLRTLLQTTNVNPRFAIENTLLSL